MTEVLDDEDAKLVTLARGARGRIAAVQGAAVRDDMGRTYSGASVQRDSLQLTALELAVAQAIAAGARGLECAVVCGPAEASTSIEIVRDFGGAGVPVLFVGSDGTVRDRMIS